LALLTHESRLFNVCAVHFGRQVDMAFGRHAVTKGHNDKRSRHHEASSAGRCTMIQRIILALLITATFGIATPGFAVPIVSPSNIFVDDSACVVPSVLCQTGDTIVASWDNSILGDNNTGNNEPTSVTFSFAGTPLPATPTFDIWSVAFTILLGFPMQFDIPVLVTVVAADGSQTGPVQSLQTFSTLQTPLPSTLPLFVRIEPVGLRPLVHEACQGQNLCTFHLNKTNKRPSPSGSLRLASLHGVQRFFADA
jgi:hypothetical protein